jgi:hypothetical protein
MISSKSSLPKNSKEHGNYQGTKMTLRLINEI